jgi:hypothetical protein
MSAKPERQRPGGRQLPELQPRVEPIHIGDSGTTEDRISESSVVSNYGSSELPDSASAEGPKYTRMVRKDARLRPDQVEALTALRRRAARGRHGRAERITENTLIRLAVDLLLAHADRLHGDDEDTLRRSLL